MKYNFTTVLLFLAHLAFAQTATPPPPAELSLHVFPNPTPGPLVVQTMPLHANVALSVFDAAGQPVLVLEQYHRLSAAPLDLSALAPGQYLVEVRWKGQVRRQSIEKIGGGAAAQPTSAVMVRDAPRG